MGNLSVRPVEGVKNPIGFRRFDRNPACADAERSLTALPFLPDKSVGELDVGKVIFTGDGILESVATPFADAFGFEYTFRTSPFDQNLGFDQSLYLKGRPEEFPGHAAEFPCKDLSEHLDLLIGDGRIHDEDALAIAFMNRLRPSNNGCALDTSEIDI